MEESASNESAQHGTDPVNPVVAREICRSHTGTKATRWVDRCAGIVDTGNFDDKEGNTDTDGGDEGVFRFLGSKHQDCENQVSRQELWDKRLVSRFNGSLGTCFAYHLKEKTLRHAHVRSERGLRDRDINRDDTVH
jgi:hypothetical protein